MNLYQYNLPEDLIAREPAPRRDASRLFVYDTQRDEISFDVFLNLDQYLSKDSVLVVNDTKVVPARIVLFKETGGKVEVLLLLNEKSLPDGSIKSMIDRKVAVGDILRLPENGDYFEVMGQDGHFFFLKPNFDHEKLNGILQKRGLVPIPKYIKNSPLAESDLRERYQSVFAKNPASVAAPTASLHFTDTVLSKLDAKGIKKVPVTLHVGLGTFAPVTESNLAEGKLHSELYDVPPSSAEELAKAKQSGRRVAAVGTTVVRTLESAAQKILDEDGRMKISGSTEIFIRPGFEFQIVDSLITNFHLPGSSLMMLVEAFLQSKGAKRHLVDLYKMAIKEKFRFYSFGDAMLIK